MTSMQQYKERIFAHCVKLLEERIYNSQKAMNNAQAAANEEEKSSAGDKYETSRAMSQLDKDMHARQLSEHQNELAALLSLNLKTDMRKISPGSLIETGETFLFIACGLGKINFEDKALIILSPKAPLAKTLLGKLPGEEITLNKKTEIIKAVY